MTTSIFSQDNSQESIECIISQRKYDLIKFEDEDYFELLQGMKLNGENSIYRCTNNLAPASDPHGSTRSTTNFILISNAFTDQNQNKPAKLDSSQSTINECETKCNTLDDESMFLQSLNEVNVPAGNPCESKQASTKREFKRVNFNNQNNSDMRVTIREFNTSEPSWTQEWVEVQSLEESNTSFLNSIQDKIQNS